MGAESVIQAVVQFVAGLIAAIAAAALAHIGVDLERPRSEPREVHRTADCGDAEPASAASRPERAC